VLEANGAVLQVIEKHTDDSNNFFFVEVVKNLANEFNDHKSEVLKTLESKMMVRDNPEGSNHVVSDLTIMDGLILQELLHDLETTLVNKLSGELISLQKIHKAGSVASIRQLSVFVISLLKHIIEELSSFISAVLKLDSFDEH